MADVSPVAELLGQAFYHFDRMRPLLPTYGHLLVSALFPIWIGSHASLTRPSSAAKPPKKQGEDDNEDDTDDEEKGAGPLQKMEGLAPSDALIFPLTAGLTLGGLYLVIKWLGDPAILNKILSFYFSQMGLFFAFAFLKDALSMIRSFVFPRYYSQGGKLWKARQSERRFIAYEVNSTEAPSVRHSPLAGICGQIPLPVFLSVLVWKCRNASYQRLQVRTHVRGLFDIKCLVGLLEILSATIALSAVGYFAFVEKPWWLTNFLGFCFCYGTLQFMSPSTFWTGTLILGSLFFYDIYFVFFTPLMVTVATKLDVPIKLLFPRPPNARDTPGVTPLAMLGLGDIVIPGMMLGLALRFDLFLYYHRKGVQKAKVEGSDQTEVKPPYQSATGAWGERFWAPTTKPLNQELQPPYYDARKFPKTYFKAGCIGYVIGMITTLLAMQYSNHAQPALLYLVPGVLISLWGTALVRGEVPAMWEFSDGEELEETEKEKEEKEEREKKEKKEAEKESNETGAQDKLPQSQRSLFTRLFCGECVSVPTNEKSSEVEKDNLDDVKSDSKSSGSGKSGKEKKDKKQTAKGKGSLDLISFSVSMPSKPKKAKISSNDTTATSEEEEQGVLVSRNVDGDDEPPLKRRRRGMTNNE